MITITKDFDGQKFAEKYNLGEYDFKVKNNMLICPSLPELKQSDILDCVVDETKEHKRKGLAPLDMSERDFRLFVLDQININLDENDKVK